jgi:RNA polymerase sigma factor (TIGR02999 family)
MNPQGSNDVTELLVAWSNGDRAALDSLVPLIYAELHRLASRAMRHEGPGHTLNTTALVNEAYLRMINQQNVNWQNRAHFFAVSAQSMRNILIDMARSRNRQRRGGDATHVSLDEALVFSEERASELIALDDALTALGRLDERQSRIVELRYFGGLSVEETAEVLGISAATIDREWRRARAWLYSQLNKTV